MPVVANIADLAEGKPIAVRIGADDVLVGIVSGRLFAIANQCPHAGSPLTRGSITGCEITCPRHGAVIDLVTGECVMPPGLATVRRFAVRVERGRVVVEV